MSSSHFISKTNNSIYYQAAIKSQDHKIVQLRSEINKVTNIGHRPAKSPTALSWWHPHLTPNSPTQNHTLRSQGQLVLVVEDILHMASGAGTNLKVGGTGSARKWGGTDPAQSAVKIFGGAPPFFWLYKSTISRFDERFRGGQYSLASLFFAVLLITVPPCPDICKSEGVTCPPCPMDSAPLHIVIYVGRSRPRPSLVLKYVETIWGRGSPPIPRWGLYASFQELPPYSRFRKLGRRFNLGSVICEPSFNWDSGQWKRKVA